jgi:hypothetical protein
VPFYIFSIGSGFVVLGFSFGVISATSGLTKINGAKAKQKILFIGVTSVVAGLIVALMSYRGMGASEKDTMVTTGLNITALGVSTLIQYTNNSKTQKVLRYITWGFTIIGFLMCVTYVLFST